MFLSLCFHDFLLLFPPFLLFCLSYVALYQGSIFPFLHFKRSQLIGFLFFGAFGSNEGWRHVSFQGAELRQPCLVENGKGAEWRSSAKWSRGCVSVCVHRGVFKFHKKLHQSCAFNWGFYRLHFKENNGKCGNWLCVCVHSGVCVCVCALNPLLSEVRKARKSRKGQNSTLISSTYGRVSHISLIRFIGISLPPPEIVRVWKKCRVEGPLIS